MEVWWGGVRVGVRGAEWKIGASESVNVSHSAAVLHGFNKAGTCSVCQTHCAIEGLVHESGGWLGRGGSPQPHSSGEQNRKGCGGWWAGGSLRSNMLPLPVYTSCFGITSLEHNRRDRWQSSPLQCHLALRLQPGSQLPGKKKHNKTASFAGPVRSAGGREGEDTSSSAEGDLSNTPHPAWVDGHFGQGLS